MFQAKNGELKNYKSNHSHEGSAFLQIIKQNISHFRRHLLVSMNEVKELHIQNSDKDVKEVLYLVDIFKKKTQTIYKLKAQKIEPYTAGLTP